MEECINKLINDLTQYYSYKWQENGVTDTSRVIGSIQQLLENISKLPEYFKEVNCNQYSNMLFPSKLNFYQLSSICGDLIREQPNLGRFSLRQIFYMNFVRVHCLNLDGVENKPLLMDVGSLDRINGLQQLLGIIYYKYILYLDQEYLLHNTGIFFFSHFFMYLL